MIGGAVVREVPDNMFIGPANVSNSSSVDKDLNLSPIDARRVQVAVVLTTMVGIIQVSQARTRQKEGEGGSVV